MAASATCSINVAFAPTATGAQTGTLHDRRQCGPDSPQTVALSGTGAPATVLQLVRLALSMCLTNTASAAQSCRLNQLSLAGPERLFDHGIGRLRVAGGGSCSTPALWRPIPVARFSVAFAPTAAGLQPGTLTIFTNSPNSPQSVSLSGTGMQPCTHRQGSWALAMFLSIRRARPGPRRGQLLGPGLSISSITASAVQCGSWGTCSTTGT